MVHEPAEYIHLKNTS